jgi:hypothetical protein
LDRDELGSPSVDRVPSIWPNEERPVEEVALHFWGKMRMRAFAVEVNDLDVLQLRSPAAQGVEEHRRRGGGAMDVYLLA